MLGKGKTIKTASGRCIRIDGLFKTGGQAELYLTMDKKMNCKGVLKKFHRQFVNRQTAERIRFLIDQGLGDSCPGIVAPIDMICKKDLVAHYTIFVDGQDLEDYLVKTNNTLKENIRIAIKLTSIIAELHSRGIAHGDLHAVNVMIQKIGADYALYVIDLDNYNASGVSPPPMLGQRLYIAPELQDSLMKGKSAIPDISSDLFSLGILIHEIVLLKHIVAGYDIDEKQFLKAMYSDRWVHDPAGTDQPLVDPGGYPAKAINAELTRLFRLSLSRNRDVRPSAEQWNTVLTQTVDQIHICSACNGDCVIDTSKTHCPFCGIAYPALQLHTTKGTVIDLRESSVVVGRSNLNGSSQVSMRHAIFRRIGPQTWMESLGRNGTCRWAGTEWIRLPDRNPILVQKNDRFKFADLEVISIEIN